MRTFYADGMTHAQCAALADRVDPKRWITDRRPIILWGRLAWYWTLCDKGRSGDVRLRRNGDVVLHPRLRWVDRIDDLES